MGVCDPWVRDVVAGHVKLPSQHIMQALVRTVVACSRPVGAGRVLARGLRQAGASIIRGRAAEKKARPFQEIDPLDCVWYANRTIP